MSLRGFTIIELLVVIIVIAILATIGIVTYNGVQDRARATAIVSGIKSIEKAMRMALITGGATEWWDDEDYLDDNGEPALSVLIEETNLKKFMPSVPRTNSSTGEDNSFWMYDNDLDEYDPSICPQAHRSGGVNIQIELHNNLRLAQLIDDMLDDGDLQCGKFREHHSNEGEFMWLLSPNWREV